MTKLDRLASYDDFRALARARLPTVLFDYIDGGSFEQATLRNNARDLADLPLDQRVMRDMSELRLDTECFGQKLAMPLILGPVGFAGMYARRGEVQAGRAAHAAGLPYCLSTVGICAPAEVAENVGASPWFQLYITKDRGVVRANLEKARAAGCPVLMLTVDLPMAGQRYRDIRSGMMRKLGPVGHVRQALDGLSHPQWLWQVYWRGRPHSFGSLAGAAPDFDSFAQAWAWIGENFDRSVTWADLDFIREHWSGPICVKGILHPEDARAAADCGVDGIVVSNHGGRQLDGARSSISQLPRIVEAVGDRLTVLMDGGIRSGLDIAKALDAGARACLIGRAWAFALAAGGEAGVAAMLAQMHAGLLAARVLSGAGSVRPSL